MSNKLGRRGRKAVDAASRPALESILAGMIRHLQADKWIDDNNRYRTETTETLKSDAKKSIAVAHADLAEYIAASAPLHCADGWSFLGRALMCHARGDADSARHLAYYAELRGAVSLLATEGIGIFSNLHYAVNNSGQCVQIPGPGTHEISWQALEYWANLSRSSNLLGTAISPANVPLANWLTEFGAGINAQLIGSRLLKRWGLDLQYLSVDREARNEASYRPTRLVARIGLDAPTSASFLRELWGIHEPSTPSRFERMDRHLLRLSLEQVYEAITGNKPGDDAINFRTHVKTMVSNLVPGGLTESQWADFLTRTSEPDTPGLINEASGSAPVTDPHHHIEVIARANLLLRVATGACAQLLSAAGIGRGDLEFWWRSLGEDRGLWKLGDEPEDFTDLWLDVSAELDNASEWETANAGGASIARWLDEQSRTINVLGGCERIVLWGMGL